LIEQIKESNKMSDQTKDPIPDFVKQQMEDQAAQGKRYPPEFVGNLAEMYNEAVTEWLKANKIPKEVIEAVDNLVMLERVHAGLRAGNLSDWEARWMYQEHVNLLAELATLGGEFGGFSREPVMWNAIAELPVKS
jgi:hypothetical protein